jgi:hypothetical protein
MGHHKKIAEFDANYEDTGESVIVVAYQDTIVSETLDGREEIDGLKILRTKSGQHLNYEQQGRYRDLNDRVIVSSAINAV